VSLRRYHSRKAERWHGRKIIVGCITDFHRYFGSGYWVPQFNEFGSVSSALHCIKFGFDGLSDRTFQCCGDQQLQGYSGKHQPVVYMRSRSNQSKKLSIDPLFWLYELDYGMYAIGLLILLVYFSGGYPAAVTPEGNYPQEKYLSKLLIRWLEWWHMICFQNLGIVLRRWPAMFN